MLPIVLVDDSPEDGILAQRVITQCRIQNPVVMLKSGQACLDYFRGGPPFEKRELPCLLLLDMVMSVVSGLNVLLRLRDMPTARSSVVVMMSGMADLRTIHQGYQLGANTFLVKPIAVDDMMQMFRAVRSVLVKEVPRGYELSISGEHLVANNPGLPETPTLPNLLL